MASTVRTGTSHFVTLYAAFGYYATQGEDMAAVKAKVKDGSISIGPPKANPGQAIGIDPSEGRYFIESKAAH